MPRTSSIQKAHPTTDLVGLMKSARATFSPAEQRMVEVILQNINDVLNDSIVELARRTRVSPPTVTRFCRRLGCDRFAEFKVRLAQSRFLGTRYLTPQRGPSSPTEIAEHIVNCAQTTIHTIHHALDFAVIDRVADLIAQAKLVLAFGSGGSSSMIAMEIENRLFRLGLHVLSSNDHQIQLMRAAGAPPGTVIVASSFSGRNRALAEALRAAGDYGVPRIALTQANSLVAAEADEVLAIDLSEGQDILRPTSTRYAYLLVIDVVAQVVAARLGKPAVENLRRIKHQFVTTRDIDDRQVLGD